MLKPRDDLDERLGEALKDYGRTPESAGLEQRVLARIRADSRQRTRRLAWLATSLAAGLSCLLVWQGAGSRDAGRPPALGARVEAARVAMQPVPGPRLTAALMQMPHRRTLRRREASPKLERFPGGSPMTGEERALLQLATLDWKEMPREWTHPGQLIVPIEVRAIETGPPIQVKAIGIDPLEEPGKGR